MKDNTNMLYFPVGQSANILVGQKQEESYKMTLPNQALQLYDSGFHVRYKIFSFRPAIILTQDTDHPSKE